VSKRSMELFERNHVMNQEEMHARHEIELEKYTKKVQIEGRMIGELALTHIVPAAVAYQNELIQSIEGMEKAGVPKKSAEAQRNLVNEIAGHVSQIIVKVNEMTESRKKANTIEDAKEKAVDYCEKVKPFFDEIRSHVDDLELLVDDNKWPLPKYREMLFIR